MKICKTILCVDDDPDDLQLLREAIERIDSSYTIVEAYDGEDGLRRLNNMKESNQLPCLIVLDINMPKMDGKQAFVSIKSDEVLAQVPVVIFSTSNSAMDKMFFSKKNAEYITKPIDFFQLIEVANRLLSFCSN